ncbi:hypothetical protein BDQ17DRAFT_415810 [Cyathus striatus]|nr:hypothetical protein BDQ17DRAFT_415810 [Cyathus striatus]
MLHSPSRRLVECSAWFMNIAKIKGPHNAMSSGILAIEGAFRAVTGHAEADVTQESTLGSEAEAAEGKPVDMKSYDSDLRRLWIWNKPV